MNVFAVPFFEYWGLSLLALIMLWLLGQIALPLFDIPTKNNYVALFFKQTLGVIIAITVYALIKTGFNSIFYLSLLILIMLVIYSQNKQAQYSYSSFFTLLDLKPLAVHIIVFSFLYITAYYFYYIYLNAAIFGDNHFYANVADRLLNFGVESTMIDPTIEPIKATLYHFTQHWFTALFAELFSKPTLAVYYLFYVPIMGAVVVQGAMAMLFAVLDQHSKKLPLAIIVLAGISFLFFQNISVPFLPPSLKQTFTITTTWFHLIKLSIVFIIFQAVIILAINKHYVMGFGFLILLVPLYSPVSPAILSGLFAMLCFLLYKREIPMRMFITLILLIAMVAAGYLLFYYLQSPTSETGSISKYTKADVTQVELVPVFFLTLKRIAKLFLVGLIPAAALLITLFRLQNTPSFSFNSIVEDNKKVAYPAIIFFLGAIFFLFLAVPAYTFVNHDAYQLLINFALPFVIIVFFGGFVLLLNGYSKTYATISLVVVLGWFVTLTAQNPSIFFNMSKQAWLDPEPDMEYFLDIKKLVENNPDAGFAYYRTYEGRHLMLTKPFLFAPDSRIAHFIPRYIPLSLSVFELPESTDVRYSQKGSFAFYRYVQLEIEENNKFEINTLTASFILKHNIRFIIVENDARYPLFLEAVSHQIIENKKNGNLFFPLDQEAVKKWLSDSANHK